MIGKRGPLTLILAGILAGGHVLLEDVPGLGKTLAARSFAQTLGLSFKRAQFTPDLLPADLTGSFIYDQRSATFEFRRGPLFTNLLLADEINRTPPKTQAALLEAMQERQITVEGQTFTLDAPFHVLATANPVEYEGTFNLPEAQLDRFMLRISFGYPSADDERDVLVRRVARRQEEQTLRPVTNPGGLLQMQAAVETTTVDDTVGRTPASRSRSASGFRPAPDRTARRVTGRQLHEDQERQDRDDDEDENGVEQPASDVPEHGIDARARCLTELAHPCRDLPVPCRSCRFLAFDSRASGSDRGIGFPTPSPRRYSIVHNDSHLAPP